MFRGMWALEDMKDEQSDAAKIVMKAIENPRNYVIKPQKEGGGNNYFDEEVKTMLTNEPYETLKNYLIMEKIDAPVIKTYMLRRCNASYQDSISEMGIYSCLFAKNRGED
mmetsp:Transcript_118894/g.165734  ORF Transcript_118894/g.165734 Transcript_118894/m.165734 type:complete len:110 (-) Transcript_118894:180-509(-)